MSCSKLIDTSSLDHFVQSGMVPSCMTESEWNKFFHEEVTLVQQQISLARQEYRHLIKYIIQKLRSKSKWKWDHFNSGSMFDDTKVDEPDEFDCLLVPDLPSGSIEAEFHGAPPGFCFIRVLKKGIFPSFCENGLINAKKWRNHFKRKLENFIKSKRKWQCERSYEGAPTVPVSFADIDVDLVPALHLEGWPPSHEINGEPSYEEAPAVPGSFRYFDFDLECWTQVHELIVEHYNSKIPVEIKKKGHHVVAKAYKKEHVNKDFLWRLAFNNAEKEITRSADSIGDTCRKQILRTVKMIFDIAKEDLNSHDPTTFIGGQLHYFTRVARPVFPIEGQTGFSELKSVRFSTYDLRSLMWSIWYDGPNKSDKFWNKKNIHNCRKYVLGEVQKMLSGELVVHNFFVPKKRVANHLSLEERRYFYVIAKFAELLL